MKNEKLTISLHNDQWVDVYKMIDAKIKEGFVTNTEMNSLKVAKREIAKAHNLAKTPIMTSLK